VEGEPLTEFALDAGQIHACRSRLQRVEDINPHLIGEGTNEGVDTAARVVHDLDGVAAKLHT